MGSLVRRRATLSVNPLPHYVTASEAAAWLSVSLTTLNRFVREQEDFPQPIIMQGTRVKLFLKTELVEHFKRLESKR